MEAKRLKTGVLHRSVAVTREAIDTEKRTVKLTFSSEEPVLRWFGWEVLGHSPSEVQLDRLKQTGAFLLHHDPRLIVGVPEEVSIGSDRRGHAVVRFGKSPRAEEAFQDTLDNILRNISVGYVLDETEEVGEKDGEPVWRATKWTPVEISLVGIPADVTVGVGRDISGEHETLMVGRGAHALEYLQRQCDLASLTILNHNQR